MLFGNINGTLNESLTEDECLILGELIVNPSITQIELCERTGFSRRSVSRIFSKLKDSDYIERIGSNKSGYWKVLK